MIGEKTPAYVGIGGVVLVVFGVVSILLLFFSSFWRSVIAIVVGILMIAVGVVMQYRVNRQVGR